MYKILERRPIGLWSITGIMKYPDDDGWIEPETGKLFVFQSLACAKVFRSSLAYTQRNLEIWEVECEHIYPCESALVDPAIVKCAVFRRFWERKEYSRHGSLYETHLVDVPPGTLLTDRVRLIRKVHY